MSEKQTSKYWLDLAALNITEHFPDGDIIVSSGISPSASYHIGHFREILTADALAWAIRRLGRRAEHIHVVDDFDPLRRRYDFLPKEFEAYVGQPICLAPDPAGDCHQTYADHFYTEFEGYALQMGLQPDKVIRSYKDLYLSGRMAKRIEQVLKGVGEVREIFEKVSGRRLPDDWTPVQVLGRDNVLVNASIDSWEPKKQLIGGQDYAKGRAKLNWRLDWPARWAELGVLVEPFSAQEHGAAGGSYDTGVEFARRVFKITPPIPGVQYANIHLVGDTKKMSSSKGNLVTPGEALPIMPAEVLRYFVVRSKPDRTLYFDPGVGLYNLIDEYSKIKYQVARGERTEFQEAYQFASEVNRNQVGAETITSVPFNHLVAVFQTSRGDVALAHEVLRRTGYDKEEELNFEVLEREFSYVSNWLSKYAPESVKFTVQQKLPSVETNQAQKRFLNSLAEKLEKTDQVDGQIIHDWIYAGATEVGLKPQEAFRTLYGLILQKDSGPKAGWFLASLDRPWLVKRLRLKG